MINNNEKISKDFTYHVDSLLRCVCIIHTSPSAISPRDLRTDFGRCPLETGTSDIHHGGCVLSLSLSFFFHGATWISHLAGLFVSSLLRKGKKKSTSQWVLPSYTSGSLWGFFFFSVVVIARTALFSLLLLWYQSLPYGRRRKKKKWTRDARKRVTTPVH